MSLPAAKAQNAPSVLSKATVRAAEQLDVRQVQLAKVLGLSAATTSRLAAGAWLLPEDSKAWEARGSVRAPVSLPRRDHGREGTDHA